MSRFPQGFGRAMNRGANPLVSRATAEIAAHRAVDIPVARHVVLREQGRGAHDLSGLTIATLHDIEGLPGFLGSQACRITEAFDGGDLRAGKASE